MLSYLLALEDGDFDAIASICEQAERDPDLAQRLDELHEEWIKEDGITITPEEMQQVRLAIWKALQTYGNGA